MEFHDMGVYGQKLTCRTIVHLPYLVPRQLEILQNESGIDDPNVEVVGDILLASNNKARGLD